MNTIETTFILTSFGRTPSFSDWHEDLIYEFIYQRNAKIVVVFVAEEILLKSVSHLM